MFYFTRYDIEHLLGAWPLVWSQHCINVCSWSHSGTERIHKHYSGSYARMIIPVVEGVKEELGAEEERLTAQGDSRGTHRKS